MSKGTHSFVFYVQFRRSGGDVRATAVTQTPPRVPRVGSGAMVLKVRATVPSWIFDPLDLVADLSIAGEEPQPLIRLDAVGPVLPETPT